MRQGRGIMDGEWEVISGEGVRLQSSSDVYQCVCLIPTLEASGRTPPSKGPAVVTEKKRSEEPSTTFSKVLSVESSRCHT